MGDNVALKRFSYHGLTTIILCNKIALISKGIPMLGISLTNAYAGCKDSAFPAETHGRLGTKIMPTKVLYDCM